MARKTTGGEYEDYRDEQGERSRKRSAAGREIGPLPEIADPDRRNRGIDSLEYFARTYFPARFPLPFCDAHRLAMRRLEACTTDGGRFALSFMRGGGKTTLAEVEVIRAVLYGLRRFVVLVQATEKLVLRSLKKIQRELEANDLLLADFPEAVYPVRRLERNVVRARMQTLGGKPTNMEWHADGFVLPTVPGSPSSGAIVYVAGITGAVKGLSAAGPSGEILRPDMCLIDDAQTRESAKSPTQTADREMVITDDILGLGGPESTVAAVNLCTPIYPNDLSERFLDPEKHPEWHGVRTRMLEKFPDRTDLWDEYGELLLAGLRERDGGKRARDFYLANREEMGRGAAVTWPERTKAGADQGVDGLELAMKLYYRNPRGFKSEYQCEPDEGDAGADAKQLDPGAVAARVNGVGRYAAPKEATKLTAFIDPGKWLHWYAVVAWNERGGGGVVDYGCWPRQARTVFDKADARPSLEAFYNRGGTKLNDEQLVFAGLRDLAAEVLGRTYYRDGSGDALAVERCLIDTGYGAAAVTQYVRQSTFRGLLVPSKGMARSSGRGVAEWSRRPGEKVGHHWKLTVGERAGSRLLVFDADEWKSRLFALLTSAPGDGGGLFLFGTAAGSHPLVAEHCGAESSTREPHRGGTFDKWRKLPDRPDNDLFDALVGCAVAAGYEGVRWSADPAAPAAPPKKAAPIDLKAMRAKELGARALR